MKTKRFFVGLFVMVLTTHFGSGIDAAHGREGRDMVEQRLVLLGQKLGLTRDQQQRVRLILKERAGAVGKLQAQIRKIRQSSREQIKALLTDGQKKLYKGIRVDEIKKKSDRFKKIKRNHKTK